MANGFTIDDQLMERLRACAARQGKPVEQLIRDVLENAAKRPTNQKIAIIERIRATIGTRRPGSPSAEELIRADRDSR